MSENKFKIIEKNLISNGAGIEIEYPGSFSLLYRDNGRSIKFRIDHTYIKEVLFTYLVYVDERPRWSETGEAINQSDFDVIQANVRAALLLFGGVTAFIAPSHAAAQESQTSQLVGAENE